MNENLRYRRAFLNQLRKQIFRHSEHLSRLLSDDITGGRRAPGIRYHAANVAAVPLDYFVRARAAIHADHQIAVKNNKEIQGGVALLRYDVADVVSFHHSISDEPLMLRGGCPSERTMLREPGNEICRRACHCQTVSR
ncbi:MAG: hypothetical protein ACRD3J_17975 [Thermoanaerobaculia bacterium]